MPKSPRYWTRLILTFISRFKLIFFVGIGIGIIVFIFFELLFPNLPKGTTKIGIVGEYTPDNLPISISRSISVGLTNLDKTGSPIIGVSDKWEASDSGKVWTFHLNDNLHWQDGSDLTSKDIKYNFSDAAMSTPDKYTVIFKLKTPLSTFPAIVSKPIFKKGLLGLGEWRVTGLTLAGSYIETLTIQDKDNNQRIYKFYPTEDRARLAYELGGIDELTDLMDSKPFSSWNVANVTKNVNTQRYVAIFFNTTDGLTGDKDFRQALNYAIDKNQFGQKRAFGPISPASWAYNPSLKPYDQDIPHAKELITEAKIDPATRKDLKIKLTTTPDLLSQAEIIAKDWEKIGVKTTVQVTSYSPEDYQAFLATYDIPNDPDQYSTWHHTQTQTNLTKYNNARIDKLLEDGRLETNQEKRKQIYFDFQRFLVEDSPAAFLYYPVYFSVSKK
jgi:peptide/nickel transport system substrate-binding protein